MESVVFVFSAIEIAVLLLRFFEKSKKTPLKTACIFGINLEFGFYA